MKQPSRRSFVKNLGLGLSSAAILPTLSAFETHFVQANQIYTGKKLNVALCGLGRYANILAYGLLESQYCQLAGIITGTPSKAKSWKKKYDIPEKNIYNYKNFDQIATNKDIDLVYVVLPNGMHKEYTIRAAKAGKHVIVEKPMAITALDCQEMIDACNEANVQLAVGYRLHYEPHHIEIKRLGQEKVFGEVRLIHASLGYDLTGTPLNDWHLDKALAGGGALMNLGVYCVQSNRYVLGEEPIAVTAQFAPKTMPDLFKEVEENITWQLNFPGGALCTSSVTSNCNIDRFYASAANGFFELSPAISYGPFKGRTSEKEFDFPVINQQAAQLDGIGRLILEGKELPIHISGEEGLKDMRVIEAIYKAAETGEKIEIG
ncbi:MULTISPECIES: Gfo/Idh/MocA family protein [Leeuwenhoekiella]|uniref:Gfo/Idh/MocA family protein n=1 Tax=Leeuwenhoekiella TaxID=283735 RepID=UPI000C42F97B|nr:MULTISPECIES: Gfo/Idh/MocA family oxidoreductase [Leeuwenhoekiella]MAO44181.1 glucose-fructose oxidoreductase [Leeuwenhoekiella sp.]HAB26827.1 glucose-fructose oxidoreductase [Xanthomarina gelatinilytica]|tara:strand:+ start:1285 stop:2412 length:1128 start_codon:yes stop_codon:yes gene_type:complete